MPQESVYDKIKLVVINEIFREMELNQRFHQYATGAGFHVHFNVLAYLRQLRCSVSLDIPSLWRPVKFVYPNFQR